MDRTRNHDFDKFEQSLKAARECLYKAETRIISECAARRKRRFGIDYLAMSILFVFLFFVYVSVSTKIFQYRNPTANSMTLWSYPYEVLTLQKLPEFQPR